MSIEERFRAHFISHHEETDVSLEDLIDEAAVDHPGHDELWYLQIIHNRQHTSLDWDAGHPEHEIKTHLTLIRGVSMNNKSLSRFVKLRDDIQAEVDKKKGEIDILKEQIDIATKNLAIANEKLGELEADVDEYENVLSGGSPKENEETPVVETEPAYDGNGDSDLTSVVAHIIDNPEVSRAQLNEQFPNFDLVKLLSKASSQGVITNIGNKRYSKWVYTGPGANAV